MIGVINSDPAVRLLVETAFEGSDRSVQYLWDMTAILDFLNYDIPEVVIINFADPKIDIEGLVRNIQGDRWLLEFGIIGLFSAERQEEERLQNMYQAINVLFFLDIRRIRSHLLRSVEIIEQNGQIIFQREFSRDLVNRASGSFSIENDILAAPLYAGIGATILAQRGLIEPAHKMRLQLALEELIVNAVEHGNCGITYEEKTEALERGLSVVDLVTARCEDPRVRDRSVELQWDIRDGHSLFTIIDEGEGFDVAGYLRRAAEEDQYSPHGRGIKMATLFSRHLAYNDKGNQVTLQVDHVPSPENTVPQGFSHEEVLLVKKGDLIIREGDPGNCLYYISSGCYSVFHQGKQVAVLTPQDIFMGEMEFLLDHRRSASVWADTEGKLIRVSRKAFVKVIRQYPHYGLFLSKLLARRLARTNEKLANAQSSAGSLTPLLKEV